jgi:3-phenylpropionate/cinnamic acid dioxygenase small subunit
MNTTHDTAGAMNCIPGGQLHGEVLQFLYQEAALLDDARYAEWLALLAPDLHYVMPVRTTELRARGPGFQDFAFLDDDLQSMTTRIKRLLTETAWAESPPSRTRHYINNVLVKPGRSADEYEVSGNFLITRTRGDQGYQLFTGRREDLLRRQGSCRFLIAKRRILVDQTVITGTNLSILF